MNKKILQKSANPDQVFEFDVKDIEQIRPFQNLFFISFRSPKQGLVSLTLPMNELDADTKEFLMKLYRESLH